MGLKAHKENSACDINSYKWAEAVMHLQVSLSPLAIPSFKIRFPLLGVSYKKKNIIGSLGGQSQTFRYDLAYTAVYEFLWVFSLMARTVPNS